MTDSSKNALIQAARERMLTVRRKAAVYDGDLERARPAYHVGQGWHDILDDLVKDFAEIENVGFVAAHEKFGGLRVAFFYGGDFQADVDIIVKKAADRCKETCRYCGQPGRMRQERWWRVRCEKHWDTTNE